MRFDIPPGDDGLVLVVPPTRRDGEVTQALLARAGLSCRICPTLKELARALSTGPAGTVVLTDVALLDPGMAAMIDALSHQEPWSDVPVVLLAQDRERSPAATRSLALLSNVTLLERPVSTRSMVSAVRAALRARAWQYRIREQLAAQERAEQALRDADRRKDEFLATLAHELRNPLAPIRTGLHVLAKAPAQATEQATRVREMMERQVAQLVRLIEDLLDLSRIATGKVTLRREPVDLRAVVAAAIEASQPVVEHAGHHLRVSLPEQPLWTAGDPSRLTQVVSNLVNNAAKYTPEKGDIEVALRHHQNRAEVSVTDNGAGIPPEMLEDVFRMFTQVNQTLDRAQGGLGIGLSLVRRLVELHGGSVTAHSEGLHRGSTFIVRLPLSPCAPMTPMPAPSTTDGSVRRSVRVLVVDDNQDAADSLSMLLEAGGHTTRKVYSGAEALQIAEEFAPEVVLCDIGLPGMDGHEVAARLRATRRHADTLLIALTGWGSDEDRRRTHNAGFDYHLVKPIDLAAIDKILLRL